MNRGSAAPRLDEEDLALLRLCAEGRTMPDVARRLAVSERTVRRRLRSVCDALEVTTPIEAVVIAARHHLI